MATPPLWITMQNCVEIGALWKGRRNVQIPPDIVVKSQAIDIMEVIGSRLRRQNRHPNIVEQQERTVQDALRSGNLLGYHAIRWHVNNGAAPIQVQEVRCPIW